MAELPKDIKEQAIKSFHKYDLDKSGFIDLRELKKLMNDLSDEMSIPRPSEEDLKSVLEDVDENKDSKIQLNEFMELFKVVYMMKNSG